MPEPVFYPAYLLVSGQLKKAEREFGIEFWDDRDPKNQKREGTPGIYIFRKNQPCQVKLGNLKIKKRGHIFTLIDKLDIVAEARIAFFHKIHADITIETFEAYRQKGYATILLGWVSDWLTLHGFIHESCCDVNNKASIKMHQKLGFEVVGHICWAKKITNK